jgi:hypothetical protein
MPFHQLIPRPFTSSAIQMYAPLASGVYGISNAREWIYIGAADNIQAALQDHLEDVQPSLMKRVPTGFVYEICEGSRRPSRQDRLVLEYRPACNRDSQPRSAGR